MTSLAPNPHLQSLLSTLAQARSDVGQCAMTAHSGRLTRAVGPTLSENSRRNCQRRAKYPASANTTSRRMASTG